MAFDTTLMPALAITNLGPGVDIAMASVRDRHFHRGDAIKLTAMIVDATFKRVMPTTAVCFLSRINSYNGALEYLNSDSDDSAGAWTAWSSAAAATTFALSANGGDATLFEKSFSKTRGWRDDIRIHLSIAFSGSNYLATARLEITGMAFSHAE